MRAPVKTTLILGAGASVTYGYPTGLKLRQDLLASTGQLESNAGICGVGTQHMLNFLEEFRHSQRPSIDSFLSQRMRDFEAVGKASVARILLANENEAALFREDGDHWYQYLIDALLRHEWDVLDLSWLSIVTFNYDRSLEWYLCRTLMSNYGKPIEEAVEKLAGLSVHHVYGCLGTPWKGANYIPYGHHAPHELPLLVEASARRLRVIPEGRDNDASLEPIRKCISEAKRICFLGFSFDETNLRRLGAPFRQHHDDISGSCMGLFQGEVWKAYRQLQASRPREEGLPPNFYGDFCRDVLRKVQVLP